MLNKNLILVLFIQIVYLVGCGSSDPVIQHKPYLHSNETCSPSITDLHQVKFQHCYMTGFPLISNGKGNKLINCYKMRAGIQIIYDSVKGHEIPDSIINTGAPPDTNITNYLGLYYWHIYNHNNQNYNKFVCGIDTITNFGNYAHNVIGLSISGGSWSFVFGGRIKRIYDTAWTSAMEACLGHEMGHQIIFTDWDHERNHCSLDTYAITNCTMHGVLTLGNMYYDAMIFCDNHGCDLYNMVTTQCTPSVNYKRFDNSSFSKSNFDAEISLEKATYLEAEDIPVYIKVKNSSDKPDTLKNLSGNTLEMSLNVSNGMQTLRHSGAEGYLGGDLFFVFKPVQENNYKFDLRSAYGSVKQEAILETDKTFLPAGNYQISLIKDKELFGKEINSNVLNFEIKKPTGEESLALNELRELYKLYPSPDVLLMYRDFAYKHYQSVYIEQAFQSYLMIRVLGDEKNYSDMIIKDCKWFVDNNPNSRLTSLVIGTCIAVIEKYENKSKALDYLNEIIKQYPDNKAGIEAKNLIDK